MSRPATGTISIMPDKKRKGKEGTHRLLATHDELHRTLYRLGVGVLRVHECHGSPRGLYDLRLLMLDPRDDLARLVALAPAPSARCFERRNSHALRADALVV